MIWETEKIHVTHFTAVFALLQWSETEPIISPGYAVLANVIFTLSYSEQTNLITSITVFSQS